MAIDFTLAPEHEEIRRRVRAVILEVVIPASEELKGRDRDAYLRGIFALREKAKAEGLRLPHMPKEAGGMGLGHADLAMVQAEAAKPLVRPWVLNGQAPAEGNMHTRRYGGTHEQKEKYHRPLSEGRQLSCLTMTEPELAGSDPT